MDTNACNHGKIILQQTVTCKNGIVYTNSSEPVSMRPIVDRQTPVKTLPSLAVGKKLKHVNSLLTVILIKRKKSFTIYSYNRQWT